MVWRQLRGALSWSEQARQNSSPNGLCVVVVVVVVVVVIVVVVVYVYVYAYGYAYVCNYLCRM